MERREPVFNAPISVLILLAVLVAMHIGRQLLGEEQEARLVIALAFVPVRYLAEGAGLPGAPWAQWISPFTHALVHGDWVHLAVNGAWLLVFGSLLVRRLGVARFLLLSLMASALGALAFYVVNPALAAPMVGASGAVSGQMGATMRLMFAAADQGGTWMLRDAPGDIRPMPLLQALTDRRVLTVIAMLVFVNVLMSFGIGGLAPAGSIAWEAHLGGFAAGLLGFGLFDRGPGLRTQVGGAIE